MLELLRFLRANGFKTYIVSGGGVEFIRPWAERVYGIPPRQVIGSSIKLQYELSDAGYLFRRPVLLARSVLAMNVVMPLLVAWLVLSLDLRPAVKIALVALSVSPVPPFLPNKQLQLTGREGYVYGLLVTSAVLAVLLVPLATAFLASLAQRGEGTSVATILQIVVLTVLLPLALGMVCRRILGSHAQRVASIANNAGTVLLIVAFLPVLIAQWPAIRSLIGDGTLLVIFAFSGIGLLVGHLFGGPDPHDRTVLALATASRHPAVALAVASAAFPDQKLAPAAVLLSRTRNLLHHDNLPGRCLVLASRVRLLSQGIAGMTSHFDPDLHECQYGLRTGVDFNGRSDSDS